MSERKVRMLTHQEWRALKLYTRRAYIAIGLAVVTLLAMTVLAADHVRRNNPLTFKKPAVLELRPAK